MVIVFCLLVCGVYDGSHTMVSVESMVVELIGVRGRSFRVSNVFL